MNNSEIKVKKKTPNNNPVPVNMGDLKPLYRIEANRLDRSMHWLMVQALKSYAKTFIK